jgi:hypothetical protein
MKILSLVFVILCLMSWSCRESTRNSKITEDTITVQSLYGLLAQKEYFEMRSALGRSDRRLNPVTKIYFQAIVANAFNQNERSSKMIDSLLNDEKIKLHDSINATLLFIKRDNYIKNYQYENAAKIGSVLLKEYKDVLGEKKRSHLENSQKIYGGLSDTKPQKVLIDENKLIPWERDKVGLINVAVKTDADSYNFILDTRASISTISKSYADKLNLRFLPVTYEESSGITGKSFQAQLAVADSLFIGTLRINNVVFQVVPDQILSFPSINYAITGIVGFPVIKQWKELRINRNGTITIPRYPEKSDLDNLAFDESTMVVRFPTGLDTLSFHFDSGASTTELYSNYYTKYESSIIKNSTRQTVEHGSAGGMATSEDYILPEFSILVGRKRVTLEKVSIHTTPSYPGQKYYGNIGQDLISQFEEMILNFEDMYIDFK